MAGFLRLLFHPGLPRRSGPTHPRASPEGLHPPPHPDPRGVRRCGHVYPDLRSVPRVETGASDAPNAYVTWTDEYLKISALPHAGWSLPQGGEYHTDNAGLQQLHDALAAYGVTGVVPSWVPEGAVLAEYDFGDEFAGTTSFYAFFSLPDGTGFRMDFMIFAEPSAMEGHWIVKDERPVSYFTLGDVGYYQYTNNASTGICWLNGRVSGLVSGKVPAEVIRSIVYSIH